MITVIDYGINNIASVVNALTKVEIPFVVSDIAEEIIKADALILPGIGAAGQGMKSLKKKGLDKVIVEQVKKGKSILGICLGMQLLFTSSEEGNVRCLDLIKGKVKKFNTKLKVPEIGWNQVTINSSILFKGIPDNSYFYFVNSYYCLPSDSTIVAGVTDYDGKFCSALVDKNIYGVQFHPEKSSDAGLQIYKNFSEVIC